MSLPFPMLAKKTCSLGEVRLHTRRIPDERISPTNTRVQPRYWWWLYRRPNECGSGVRERRSGSIVMIRESQLEGRVPARLPSRGSNISHCLLANARANFGSVILRIQPIFQVDKCERAARHGDSQVLGGRGVFQVVSSRPEAPLNEENLHDSHRSADLRLMSSTIQCTAYVMQGRLFLLQVSKGEQPLPC
jgi:hypothetical protein